MRKHRGMKRTPRCITIVLLARALTSPLPVPPALPKTILTLHTPTSPIPPKHLIPRATPTRKTLPFVHWRHFVQEEEEEQATARLSDLAEIVEEIVERSQPSGASHDRR